MKILVHHLLAFIISFEKLSSVLMSYHLSFKSNLFLFFKKISLYLFIYFSTFSSVNKSYSDVPRIFFVFPALGLNLWIVYFIILGKIVSLLLQIWLCPHSLFLLLGAWLHMLHIFIIFCWSQTLCIFHDSLQIFSLKKKDILGGAVLGS